MWAVWCESKKNRFRLDRGGLLAAGDGICFLTDRGFAGTNVNAADGDRVTPNRMEGIVRDGGLPQLRPPFQPAPRPQPYARRVIPASVLVEATAGGCQVQLYRL